MNAIEIMNEEHRYITKMLIIVRKNCSEILNGKEVNYDDFGDILEFITNYADKYHHKKEEDILFNRMIENLGETAEKVVKNGMLVEHDLGRLYVQGVKESLEKVKQGDNEAKLDVIANAISYTHLLERHIDKEDRVIYKFAQRELGLNILSEIDKGCIEFEEKNKAEKERCLLILSRLENKYN